MENEVGKWYGRLVVLSLIGRKYHSSPIVVCRCDCGNEIETNLNKLHTGHTKSCGCLKIRHKDLTGQRFGRLTVLEFAYTQGQKNYWKCQCDCGKICYVFTAWLTNGTTVSCGCKNDENRANLQDMDRGMIDGTMLCEIKEDRKLNKNNTSGIRGVTYDKRRKKWVAQLTFQRKNHLLGRFKTKKEAIAARKAGGKQYYGKYRKR